MEQIYKITGMTGDSCRSAVEKALNEVEGVRAKVRLEPPSAVMEMERPIPVETLQEVLSKIGPYTLEMPHGDRSHELHSHAAHREDPAGHRPAANSAVREGMEHSEHAHAHGMSGQMGHMGNLKQKFWVSLVVTVPIILLSSMMGLKLPFQFSFPGSDWVVFILASFLFFYGGMPFLQGAKRELKDRNPAMMTLISMGITVAYVYSLYAFVANTFFPGEGHRMDFFWELATLIVIMLLGHWVEMRAVGNAGNALQKMAELLPGSAHLVENDTVRDIPLPQLRAGQRVRVKAGEKIPADGRVVSGDTTVNESMVTGEAKGVKKSLYDQVIGGSVNGSGTITVEVTGTGESGYLAQVMKLVKEAQREKSHSETLSDKVAKALFYVAVTVGLAAFVVWYILTRDLNLALERLVTVLIIACPHALGLAIPLVVARSTSLGARNGLLIRNRNALEKSRKIAVVTMDKTGTLTEGNFRVSVVESTSSRWNDRQILATMAALESNSNHPLATGILEEAKKLNVTYPEAEDVQVISGTGLAGTVEGQKVKIVKPAYLDEHRIAYDPKRFEELSRQGNSVSYLLINEEAAGLVAQGDRIKREAGKTVEGLKRLGIEPVMLTGDNEGYAQSVASSVGIEQVRSGLLPEQKEQVIAGYQKQHKLVMMVGDGVNDAPALARADIGVAIGAGTDVAVESADVVLVKSDPSDILHFFSLAENTTRKMIQNLWWGAGYNLVAIPLAAGILAPLGLILSPAVGALLMSASTVVVALNAMALKMK